MKKRTISKSTEDAAKWRRFDQTVNRVREAFASLPDDQLRDLIDEAVLHVRKQKRRSVQGTTKQP
jgi:hypothetical protein